MDTPADPQAKRPCSRPWKQATFLSDGNLFYMLAIAPSEESNRYQPAFSGVASNLRLNDR